MVGVIWQRYAVRDHYTRHPEHEAQWLPYFKEKLAERGELDLYNGIEVAYKELRDELLGLIESSDDEAEYKGTNIVCECPGNICLGLVDSSSNKNEDSACLVDNTREFPNQLNQDNTDECEGRVCSVDNTGGFPNQLDQDNTDKCEGGCPNQLDQDNADECEGGVCLVDNANECEGGVCLVDNTNECEGGVCLVDNTDECEGGVCLVDNTDGAVNEEDEMIAAEDVPVERDKIKTVVPQDPGFIDEDEVLSRPVSPVVPPKKRSKKRKHR